MASGLRGKPGIFNAPAANRIATNPHSFYILRFSVQAAQLTNERIRHFQDQDNRCPVNPDSSGVGCAIHQQVLLKEIFAIQLFATPETRRQSSYSLGRPQKRGSDAEGQPPRRRQLLRGRGDVDVPAALDPCQYSATAVPDCPDEQIGFFPAMHILPALRRPRSYQFPVDPKQRVRGCLGIQFIDQLGFSQEAARRGVRSTGPASYSGNHQPPGDFAILYLSIRIQPHSPPDNKRRPR